MNIEGCINHGVPVQCTGGLRLRPDCRGYVTLRSADPFESPAIDPEFLTEPADREKLVEGVRLAREIAGSSPLDEYLGEEIWPGTAVESGGG